MSALARSGASWPLGTADDGSPPEAPADVLRFGSGHAVRRIEDPTLITGQGRFTDDLRREGLACLAFARSPYAHARILGIDGEAARALPGVLAVFTGADLVAAGVKPLAGPPGMLKRPDGSAAVGALRRALAHERVRFVGEAVAAIVAESPEAARAAAETLGVDYEELPAVHDADSARAPGAIALCEAAPDNVAATHHSGQAAGIDAAFAQAAHVVRLDARNQRLAPSALEPRVVLAELEPGTGRLLVTLSSQMPTAVREGLSSLLPGLIREQVRVRVGDVGGGFGMKTGLYPEDLVVAHAARTLQRPVRWTAQRLEEFTASVHGRDHHHQAEMALDAQGRVLALRVQSTANVGAYATPTGCMIPLMIGPWVATSVYDIPCVSWQATAVMTNTTPVGAYRGAGRPESIYLIERLMDAAARQLNLDPVTLRRRNLIRPEQMPYRNAMGQTYDVGCFEQMLDQALDLADWSGYAERARVSRQRGRWRGRSVTTFLEWTGGNALSENVQVDVRPDGLIELTSATMPMGQGIATSYAQLAVDVFQLPLERIRVRQGDTDRANGFGSAGSRSLFTGGSAVQVASRKTLQTAHDLAGEALEAATQDIEYRAGEFRIVGTDRRIGLFDLAAKQGPGGIAVAEGSTAAGPSWPNGAHVCEVEIDEQTGEVSVVAYASVNDIGRVISPQIVEGQLEGGAVQGIGQALCEEVVYAPDGQLLSASFMDYALPRVDGFRGFVTRFDTRVPSTNNVLGAKGVGELGTIGATPAVVNAVLDALIGAGVPPGVAQDLQMPLLAPKVWAALQQRV
ncbi:MAG: xanthine dehydrogenase family protein [Rubrivivax sp.]|nr:xanthine dehydrogenase family protein [Rubrivivax sp.]